MTVDSENTHKVIVIDNYDSFTYNLVHMIREITGGEVVVRKNDHVAIEEIEAFDYIVLSPGPGLPDEAGLLKEIIKTFASSKKILGVCLGMQAIGEVFNCQLQNLDKVFHGYQNVVEQTHNKSKVFEGLSQEFLAGRYHSWVIDKSSPQTELLVTAVDQEGEWMAVEHKDLNVYAVQFHPESIMTPDGKKIMENFLSIT